MDKLIDFFKLLSDETRLRIMVLLYHNDFCVCQLTGITGISQPNVSKHLARLRDMGLVKDERREQYTYYSLNIDEKLFKDILGKIVEDVAEYPVLKLDLEKSKAAKKYLEIRS
ncbi:MAG TPA: winged helix-turn-helix transcriptional regulator [Fastidiosipila sp.]|jgi:ArsR family transcriptional regulator|nr:metalloregulator ArsR/SmtB family transcription factor [Eubacteriales bacterium]HHU03438.1 winged helix-turn-helix transcriptional regulator [Fastidiosipila sp.]